MELAINKESKAERWRWTCQVQRPRGEGPSATPCKAPPSPQFHPARRKTTPTCGDDATIINTTTTTTTILNNYNNTAPYCYLT